MAVATNGTAMLAVKGKITGQDHVHTLHFRHGISGDGSLQSLIDAWQANCRTEYLNIFRDDEPAAIEIIRAYHVCGSLPLDATVEEVDIRAGTAPVVAGALGEKMAPWLAQVFSLRTASAGRSRRGRFFLGGLSEGQVNAGTIGNDRTNLLGKVYSDKLLAVFGPGGTQVGAWQLVVHSRKLASVPGTQCQNSSTPVTGILVRTEMGRMTSRKAGSGT